VSKLTVDHPVCMYWTLSSLYTIFHLPRLTSDLHFREENPSNSNSTETTKHKLREDVHQISDMSRNRQGSI